MRSPTILFLRQSRLRQGPAPTAPTLIQKHHLLPLTSLSHVLLLLQKQGGLFTHLEEELALRYCAMIALVGGGCVAARHRDAVISEASVDAGFGASVTLLWIL